MTDGILASSKLGEFVRNILHDKILFIPCFSLLFISFWSIILSSIYLLIRCHDNDDLMLNRGDYTASVAIEYYYCL